FDEIPSLPGIVEDRLQLRRHRLADYRGAFTSDPHVAFWDIIGVVHRTIVFVRWEKVLSDEKFIARWGRALWGKGGLLSGFLLPKPSPVCELIANYAESGRPLMLHKGLQFVSVDPLGTAF